jgi:hypothetical protein
MKSQSKEREDNPVIQNRARTVAIQKMPWTHKHLMFQFYRTFVNSDSDMDDPDILESGFRGYLATFFD